MKDFTPLLRPANPRFDAGVAADRVDAPSTEAQVITPLRGLDGVRAVSFADHTLRAPRNMYAPPPPVEDELDLPAEPVGPTEEEVVERIRAAEEAVRADYEQRLVDQMAEVEAAKARIEEIAQAVDAHRATLTSEARDQAGSLVVGAIARICGELPEALEGLLRDRIGRAAESLVGSSEVVVRIRPGDIAIAASAIGDRPGWRLEPDANLDGGCIAVSEAGSIDGSLSAAMEGIHAAAATWREESGVGGDQ